LKRWHAMGGDVTAIDTHGRSIVDHVTSSAFLEAWLSCGGPATTLNDDQTRIVDRRFSEQIRSYRGPSYVRHATDDLIINMAFIQVKHHGSISIPRSRLLKACACPHGARLRQRLVMSCSDPLCMANWIACST
jgi:hypothetical protein